MPSLIRSDSNSFFHSSCLSVENRQHPLIESNKKTPLLNSKGDRVYALRNKTMML